MTVTQVDTVQYCSPCSPDPEPSPDACVNLENNEGRVNPEMLEELKSSPAGTGLKTPGQQGPPNEGTWEQGRTTANGFLTAGVDSSQGGRIPSTTECVDTRASKKNTRITADTTCLQEGQKTFSEQNKQFDPGERREKTPLWNAAVLYLLFLSFLGGSLFVLRAVCFVCALFFSQIIFLFSGDDFSGKLKDMRRDEDQGSSR